MALSRNETKYCGHSNWSTAHLLVILTVFSTFANGVLFEAFPPSSDQETSADIEKREIDLEKKEDESIDSPLDELSEPSKNHDALNHTARYNTGKNKSFNFLSHYHRKVYADQLNGALAGKLELHIEAMEPQFQSSSFYFLWHQLYDAMTEVFRPGEILKALEDLNSCIPRIRSAGISYHLPVAVSEVRRDLTICTVDKLLNRGSKSNEDKRENFARIWKALHKPLTKLLTSPDWKKLMRDLVHYKPRFEQAGISYQPPSKISDMIRDATICKIDDIFNELYSANS